MSEDLTKATARPWIAVEGDIWDQRLDEAPGIPLFRADRSHRRYGKPPTDEAREANAALIVVAVNGYDATQALRHAFRFADSNDWDFLIGQLPDGGRGRFWKAVFEEARAALSDRAP